VIPRLTDLYARLEAAKGKKRRPAAAQLFRASYGLFGIDYADRAAFADQLRPQLADSDPVVRGLVALGIVRLLKSGVYYEMSADIAAVALRRKETQAEAVGLALHLVKGVAGEVMLEPELLLQVLRLAVALKEEETASKALRMLNSLGVLRDVSQETLRAAMPTITEIIRSGFCVEEALRVLVSWRALGRVPIDAVHGELDKLRAADDWKIRRLAGNLSEKDLPAKAQPEFSHPDLSVFVTERRVLAHPATQPEWSKAWRCCACGSPKTGMVFSLSDSSNSWRFELSEFLCQDCGKYTRYELDSG